MESLLNKISEYQLFNFLFSGTILVFLVNETTAISIHSEEILVTLFIYYLVGLIVSRVGSLIIEPIFKKLRLVTLKPYQQYLRAVKKDPKIDVFSQENNVYRTLIAMFLIYFMVYASFQIYPELLEQEWLPLVLAGSGIVLFSLSYRKQTKYISYRVDNNK
jgi:hypothetical protein